MKDPSRETTFLRRLLLTRLLEIFSRFFFNDIDKQRGESLTKEATKKKKTAI
jgi:hypothetical protein